MERLRLRRHPRLLPHLRRYRVQHQHPLRPQLRRRLLLQVPLQPLLQRRSRARHLLRHQRQLLHLLQVRHRLQRLRRREGEVNNFSQLALGRLGARLQGICICQFLLPFPAFTPVLSHKAVPDLGNLAHTAPDGIEHSNRRPHCLRSIVFASQRLLDVQQLHLHRV
jgi:hypothetical protein